MFGQLSVWRAGEGGAASQRPLRLVPISHAKTRADKIRVL